MPVGIDRVSIRVLCFERRRIAFPYVAQQHIVRLEDGELDVQFGAHRRESATRVHAERG